MNYTTDFLVNTCISVDSPIFIITQFPSNEYIFNQMAVCIVNCVLILSTLILSGVCILTIVSSTLSKEKVFFFLIAVQSTVDLTMATIGIPSFTHISYSEIIGNSNCKLIFILTITGFVPAGLSLAAMCALTFERYTSILYPIAHRKYVTKKMLLVYFCVTTVFLLIIVPIASTSVNMYYYSLIAAIGPSLLLNAVAYTNVSRGLKKKCKSNNNGVSDNSDEANSSTSDRKKRFLKESRLAKSCAIAAALFYTCYLPGLVLSFYYIQTDKLIYRVVHSWYETSIALNSTISTLIFFWKIPILRRNASKVLRRIVGSKNLDIPEERSSQQSSKPE